MAASVNESTHQLSPQVPVKELGAVLPRLFEFMARAPGSEQINFSKVDLSDGFWRLTVDPTERCNFCYVMPRGPGQPVQIVVPSALQMGWTESPAYFCAATETGRDLIQYLADNRVELPQHPLEEFLIPDPPAKASGQKLREQDQRLIQVYVDDYIIAIIEDATRTLIQRISRATLYGIHAIFPPLTSQDTRGARTPSPKRNWTKAMGGSAQEKKSWGSSLMGKHGRYNCQSKRPR